jgi:hypothetical protein
MVFYLSKDLSERNAGIGILPAAFTDHDAVVLRLSVSNVEPRRRGGRWKMDPELVTQERIRDKIRLEMAKWQRSKSYYPDAVTWWERCVKTQLRRLIRREEVERRAQHRHMENNLFECLYDILRSTIPETDKRPVLQRYKAKLVRLHAMRRNKILLDTQEHDRLNGEELSLFHVLKMHKRRVAREIHKITDMQGNTHTTFRNIAATFVVHLYNQYEPIEVDGQSMATLHSFLPL